MEVDQIRLEEHQLENLFHLHIMPLSALGDFKQLMVTIVVLFVVTLIESIVTFVLFLEEIVI